jgi:DNA uptake protein ComE-like DNA-binding protein
MAQQLDINRASLHTLEDIFHSRERAQLIVNKRELLGDFKSWEDIKEKLPGFDDALIQRLRAAGLGVGSA